VVICTPGQLARRAEFYHQWAQLTGAGLGVIQSLNQLKRSPPSRSYRQPIQRLLDSIQQGFTIHESLRALGSWLSEFDLALLSAGEQSGRMEECLRMLSVHYSNRAGLAREFVMALLYPLFLLHFAVFLFPFIEFFSTGDFIKYLIQTFGILIPLYAFTGLMIFAAQSRHGESWRAFVEELLHVIPVLGRARRELSVSRFASALEALISAGVTIIEGWQLAAAASGSPALVRVVGSWKQALADGNTPGELVSATRAFPEMFSSQYYIGETSGQLDQTLKRMARYYHEEGSRKLKIVVQWVPRFIYFGIMGMIAYKIISFYMGYFSMLRQVGGF
jgi:type II secretory pathway component PulF